MALCIMFYHLMIWEDEIPNNIFLKFYGRFAVPIFYMISGATLWYVYQHRINSLSDSLKYLFNRILRIYPLFFLVTIITILGYSITDQQHYSTGVIIENLLMLFPFYHWDKGIATGVWSVGNEIVFYFLIPILTIRRNYILAISSLITISSFLFYYYLLIEEIDISEQWMNYTNPFTQLRFFTLGIIAIELRSRIKMEVKASYGFLILILYPILFIDSVHKFMFGFLSILTTTIIFSSVYIIISGKEVAIPKYLIKIFSLFGDWSYGIYLLHPICYLVVTHFFHVQSPFLNILIITLLTIISSALSFKYFESRFLKLKLR